MKRFLKIQLSKPNEVFQVLNCACYTNSHWKPSPFVGMTWPIEVAMTRGTVRQSVTWANMPNKLRRVGAFKYWCSGQPIGSKVSLLQVVKGASANEALLTTCCWVSIISLLRVRNVYPTFGWGAHWDNCFFRYWFEDQNNCCYYGTCRPRQSS